MEDEASFEAPVTTPDLPTNEGIVSTAREFSGALTLDLTDEEIAAAYRIVVGVKHRWEEKFRRKFNDPTTFKLDDALRMVEQFEDEIKTKLAEQCQVLATVNTVPILEGHPLEIEWIGKLPGSDLAKYGMDHEKKAWEVKRANARGEDFHGQKG